MRWCTEGSDGDGGDGGGSGQCDGVMLFFWIVGGCYVPVVATCQWLLRAGGTKMA